MAGRRDVVAWVVAACLAVFLVGAIAVPVVAASRPSCEDKPDNPNCESESPSPEPSEEPSPTSEPSPSPDPSPSPSPSPEPSPSPSPSPSPEPSPSPTENCGAAEDGAVTFGDVDRDCDGTLLLSEQGDPVSIRRTVELAPPDLTEEEVAELDLGEPVARFEPTDFVPGTLVDFDTESEQGGTITEGSLVYTPPEGFTGEDRFTFFVRGSDDLVREAEVLVEVRVADLASSADDEQDPDETPPAAEEVTEDAVDRALADRPVRTTEAAERWDPPWLGWMSGIAVVLVGLGLAWWLFLERRIQDRFRS